MNLDVQTWSDLSSKSATLIIPGSCCSKSSVLGSGEERNIKDRVVQSALLTVSVSGQPTLHYNNNTVAWNKVKLAEHNSYFRYLASVLKSYRRNCSICSELSAMEQILVNLEEKNFH